MTLPQNAAPDKLRQLLAELLSENPQHIVERVEGMYDLLAAPYQQRVVIFGAGQLGRFVLPAVRNAGLEALAYCDNNSGLWGSQICGMPAMSPAEAVERYRDDACFLVAVYNSGAAQRQLRELGCHRIVPYPVFFWKYWRNLPG